MYMTVGQWALSLGENYRLNIIMKGHRSGMLMLFSSCRHTKAETDYVAHSHLHHMQASASCALKQTRGCSHKAIQWGTLKSNNQALKNDKPNQKTPPCSNGWLKILPIFVQSMFALNTPLPNMARDMYQHCHVMKNMWWRTANVCLVSRNVS